jgi:hypothetical protein
MVKDDSKKAKIVPIADVNFSVDVSKDAAAPSTTDKPLSVPKKSAAPVKSAAPEKSGDGGGVKKEKKKIPTPAQLREAMDYIKEVRAAHKIVKAIAKTTLMPKLTEAEQEAFDTIYTFPKGKALDDRHTKEQRIELFDLLCKDCKAVIDEIITL